MASVYLRRGAIFQFTAIITFIFRRASFFPASHNPAALIFIGVITVLGATAFLYCLYVLYAKRGGGEVLITTGIFKYTRHPMYTAFVLMDTASWFVPWTVAWLLSTLLFYGALFTAAYFQEKETLARFGVAAGEYYKRTPRLPFLYLFRHY